MTVDFTSTYKFIQVVDAVLKLCIFYKSENSIEHQCTKYNTISRTQYHLENGGSCIHTIYTRITHICCMLTFWAFPEVSMPLPIPAYNLPLPVIGCACDYNTITLSINKGAIWNSGIRTAKCCRRKHVVNAYMWNIVKNGKNIICHLWNHTSSTSLTFEKGSTRGTSHIDIWLKNDLKQSY